MPKISKPSPIIVGVDPGKRGGVAYFDTATREMTSHTVPEDEEGINHVIKNLIPVKSRVFVYIEAVHSMPGQGVASMFTFGMIYGMLRQAFSLFPREFVRPQTWQKALSITSRQKSESQTDFKERLRFHARRLYPEHEVWNMNLGKQRSMCDAMLIAEYGRRIKEGEIL